MQQSRNHRRYRSLCTLDMQPVQQASLPINNLRDDDQFMREKYHKNCFDYLTPKYINRYVFYRYKDTIDYIAATVPKLDICQDLPIDDYSKIITCDQHASVFTHTNDPLPIMATRSLNTCICLIMHSPTHNVASMSHIDGLPGFSRRAANDDGMAIDYSPVQRTVAVIVNQLELIRNCKIDDLDYYMIGGVFGLSEIMVHDILQELIRVELESKTKLVFRGRNLLGPINQSRNICFDARAGVTNRFSYYDYFDNFELVRDTEERYKLHRQDRLPCCLTITYTPKALLKNNNQSLSHNTRALTLNTSPT